MTYNDIITKFKIEYDKADVTSSYPSLTDYEIATVLDKAYLNLIAQKFTGNNTRRAPFENDIKVVSDLQPLVVTDRIKFGEGVPGGKKGATLFPITELFWEKTTEEQHDRNNYANMLIANKNGVVPTDTNLLHRPSEREYISTSARSIPDNVRLLKLPEKMMYFVASAIPVDIRLFSGWMNDTDYTYYTKTDTGNKTSNNTVIWYQNQLIPLDNKLRDYMKWEKRNGVGEAKHYRMQPVHLVSHQVAENFFATASNIPWVKQPVCYLESGMLFVVVDPIVGVAELPYPGPKGYTSGVSVEDDECVEWASLTYIKFPQKFIDDEDEINGELEFELSDTVAEELISLAITYGLENIESPRISTHLGLKGLES